MIKFKLKLILSGSVLLAGLVSCSSDKKIKDVYAAPSPVIDAGGTRMDLKKWQGLRTRQLDLQDVFDLTDAQPVWVGVHSYCQKGSDHYSSDLKVQGRERIPVWMLIPKELAVLNFNTADVQCGFDLNLYNAAGSNHIFPVSQVAVRETRASAIEVGPDGANPPDLFVYPHLEGIHIRYANRSAASVRLDCGDLKLKSMPFEQVMDLSNFDFNHPESTDPELNIQPLQNCRVLITEAGQPAAFSRILKIVFPRAALKVQSLTFPLMGNLGSDQAKAYYDLIVNGKSVIVGRWLVTNASTVVRSFRMNSKKFNATVSINSMLNQGETGKIIPVKMVYRRPMIRLSTVNGAGTLLRIGANQSLEIQSEMTMGGLVCSRPGSGISDPPSYGLAISDFENPVLEEVSGEGEIIGQTELPAVGKIDLAPGFVGTPVTPSDNHCWVDTRSNP